MSTFTKIFIIVIIILFLLYIGRMLKKGKIEFKYAFLWIGTSLVVLLITIFPSILAFFSSLIGIELPVNLIFFLGIILNLVITFAITASYSKMKEMVYKNTQYIALLENKIDRLEKERMNGSEE
jgi:hypothetical protein